MRSRRSLRASPVGAARVYRARALPAAALRSRSEAREATRQVRAALTASARLYDEVRVRLTTGFEHAGKVKWGPGIPVFYDTIVA